VTLVGQDLVQLGTAEGLGDSLRNHALAHGTVKLALERFWAIVASAEKTFLGLGWHGGLMVVCRKENVRVAVSLRLWQDKLL
jgi:hypothetical protein